ncbi:unnamed protein product [Ixodes persulcatus]
MTPACSMIVNDKEAPPLPRIRESLTPQISLQRSVTKKNRFEFNDCYLVYVRGCVRPCLRASAHVCACFRNPLFYRSSNQGLI